MEKTRHSREGGNPESEMSSTQDLLSSYDFCNYTSAESFRCRGWSRNRDRKRWDAFHYFPIPTPIPPPIAGARADIK